MIVPMKKVSLVVLDKDKDAALDRIRELGVVHLEQKTAASPELNRLLDRKTQIEVAAGVLKTFAPKKSGKNDKDSAENQLFNGDIVHRVCDLSGERKALQDAVFAAERDKARFEKWGDFEPDEFRSLAQNGVKAYLYEVSLQSYAKNTAEVPIITLSTDKKNNMARFIAFDRVPGEYPYPLPERSIREINEDRHKKEEEIAKIEANLTHLSRFSSLIDKEKKKIAAEIEFEAAKAGMDKEVSDVSGSDMTVSWITGYAPAPDIGVLKRAASENGWAFCAADPEPDDVNVPTKLKNSKLVSLIYPLTDFLEMSPGYREVDISGWFLLFFTLFFGMIFGDAGYGAILLITALIAIAKTAKKGTPLVLKFLLLMSVSNFLWGALSCSWFGLDVSVVPAFLQNLSLPLIANVSDAAGWLSSYNSGNFWIQSGLVAAHSSIEAQSQSVNQNLMLFCFSIALLQLGIAHIKGFFRNIKSPKCLAELGQFGMLIGMYFVVLSLVVYNTGFGGVAAWQYYFLAGGFGLVFIFGNYEGNILKAIGSSFANIITVVLGITNVFSDIMSYIRLWAVGLAGASIASTVDGFAGPMLGHFIFFVFGIALFVFGHGFNMVLNVLSVLVHGVRLNTLEFSSHVGLTWSGFAYKPFAATKR